MCPRSGGRRNAVMWFLVMALLAATFLVAGCAENGGNREGSPGDGPDAAREVAVKTLAQGIHSEYGRLEGVPAAENALPECLVITDADELQRLISLSLFQEPLGEVDFSHSLVIAVMLGPRDTGGYAVSITHVYQGGPEVRVELELVEPEPGSMNAQVLTSPYHLVTADRDSFQPGGSLLFTFLDQNDNIVSEQRVEI
ncbi:MAG: protease complex subunit PrcB family protein [Actinobacteria bacterium]|nr:protease complex subunit PrcB family protein [Actinomycetota bacterium]